MAVNIPEELRAFGITSKDFSAKKRDLAKSEEKKVKDNDVIWGLFEDLTQNQKQHSNKTTATYHTNQNKQNRTQNPKHVVHMSSK